MMSQQHESRYSPSSFETPGGEIDLNATGEGSSVFGEDDHDDDIPISDGGHTSRECRDTLSSNNVKSTNKILNIGTWNVQTMMQAGKLQLLIKELKRLNMNITGICETRWKSRGHFKSDDHLVIFSGNEKGGDRGVAVILDKHLSSALKGYNPINDRFLTIKLNTTPVATNIIQVYAPTSTCPDEEIDDFYSKLQSVYEALPSREVNIIMGDFNAKIGEGKDPQCGIGKYGLGIRNERGDLIASFCHANELTITNTLFNHHPRRRYTWTQPGERNRNQIDYIIVNNSWKSSVINSRSRPGADCDSDHELVQSTFRLKAFKNKARKANAKFDLEKLKDDKVRLQYTIQTENRFHALMADWSANEKCPEELWSEIKETITETALETIGKRKRQKHKPYISDEVFELAEKKSTARKEGRTDLYKKLRNEIKSKVKRDKKKWLEDECNKINIYNITRQPKLLFQQVAKLKSEDFKGQSMCINNKAGETLIEEEQILDRWHEYGSSLFSSSPDQKTPRVEDASKSSEFVYNKEPEPLIDEITSAIKQLKYGKSPGLDSIPGELLKHLGCEGVRAIHQLCCKIWNTCSWPKEWKLQELVMLYKGGNAKECGNYRTIALISHTSKILLIILLNRMKTKVESEISDFQAGYRKGRSTTDMLFVLQLIIEKILSIKEEAIITFIDYSKAFDSVKHDHLFKTMRMMGFPQHLISLIETLYTDQKATIRWNNQHTQEFGIEKGVRQGCILSPHLFSIYTEQIVREADIDGLGINIGGRDITNLRYADDTALISTDETSMKRLLHRMDNAGEKAGLKLNAKKTKVMTVGNDNKKPNIKVNSTPLENVNNFKYLGSIKTSNGSTKADVITRIAMGKKSMSQLNNIWRDRSIPHHLKVKLVKILIWPVMMYGCESWVLNKEEERKINAAECWCYRRLLRISWTEMRTNKSIFEELDEEPTLLSEIHQRKMGYIGHCVRNQKCTLMTDMMQGKMEGKRKKGRPAQGCLSSVERITGRRPSEIYKMCLDRDHWRSVMKIGAATVSNGNADR